MNKPKTPEELSTQIEHVVRGYLTEVQRAAQEAVARAFAAAAAPARTKPRAGARTTRPGSSRRRTADELARLQDELEALVRQHPGAAVTTFVAELQVPLRELERPMTLLKRAGRVRTVGERHLTRYFPAVGAASSAA
jgi:hypothetical protein